MLYNHTPIMLLNNTLFVCKTESQGIVKFSWNKRPTQRELLGNTLLTQDLCIRVNTLLWWATRVGRIPNRPISSVMCNHDNKQGPRWSMILFDWSLLQMGNKFYEETVTYINIIEKLLFKSRLPYDINHWNRFSYGVIIQHTYKKNIAASNLLLVLKSVKYTYRLI